MKNNYLIFWILFSSLFNTSGCSKNDGIPITNPPYGIVGTDLIKLEDAINHSDIGFANLVNQVRGSVGTSGPASKVIWSTKNDYNLGLYISANHVFGVDTWDSNEESYFDLTRVNNGIFLGSQLPKLNGNVQLGNELIADFKLYHPKIPLSATNATIFPESDFYLGIIDNQRVIDNGLAIYPNSVQTGQALQIYDPNNRTTSSQTWSNVLVNDTILVVGYPQDRTNYPNGAVSTGTVLSDSEAATAIELLKAKGDVEGEIPYKPIVEFVAKAEAISGMSGGGVFNSEGQLVGISVRATTLNSQPIVRVIRITYIRQELASFYNNLPSTDKDKLRPFIHGEL